MPFGDFYRGRRVLVTGDTGFKGGWLASWLRELGADVHGLGLAPETDPALFDILRLGDRIAHTAMDIRHAGELAAYVRALRPEVVFHLAAQALVRRSYEIPLATLDTNVMGTANLLQAIAGAGYGETSPCAVVVVTSDKCYENCETLAAYAEGDRMGGHDVYSMSKGAAELVVSSWRRSFFAREGTHPGIAVATCRAGNVIGGGDWSADRIVADGIRALMRGDPIGVRNPLSVRPWQHVLEPLSGYLQVGALLDPAGRERCDEAWNFGPGSDAEQTVGRLCDTIVGRWGSGSWTHVEQADARHEARFLKLSIDKARQRLAWSPVWDFETAVRETIEWYRTGHRCGFATATMVQKTREQIADYVRDAARVAPRWLRQP